MAKKKNVIDRIKSFEDACKDQSKDPIAEMAQFDGLPDSIRDYHKGIHRNDTIIHSLNEGKVFNWNDWGEKKWVNYYWMDDAGFRFFGAGCDYTSANAGAGSGPFASKELAEYFAKQFLHEAKAVFVR